MWTKLGIASLCLAVIALAYPTLHGVIGLGYSDKLNVFPQSTIEILGAEWFLWINHIPFGFLQRALLFVFELPLFILFLGISGIFFIIHFLAPERGR
jgi:hypothetical protein